MPVHGQRLLANIALPPSDTQRPHPALLYILFAEAGRVYEAGTPRPTSSPPRSYFSQHATTIPVLRPVGDCDDISRMRGMSLILFERARAELNHGIPRMDRVFDLARASVGIARFMYTTGRELEGWSIPVARLVVSCGLHRCTGYKIPLDTSAMQPSYLSTPYNNTLAHTMDLTLNHGKSNVWRRLVDIPPARDDIDVAERIMAFWAAEGQDWRAANARGWSLGLPDEDCTTQWPWGSGVCEVNCVLARKVWLIARHVIYTGRNPHIASPTCTTCRVGCTFSPAEKQHSCWRSSQWHSFIVQACAICAAITHCIADCSLSDRPVPRMPTTGCPPPRNSRLLGAVQAMETAVLSFRIRLPLHLHIPRTAELTPDAGL